ncbi:MAG: hypothetical protein ABIH88_03240 [Patescibacteria group bacterium]|nr:hypothetical protein [Patescibacteria group bacterium]
MKNKTTKIKAKRTDLNRNSVENVKTLGYRTPDRFRKITFKSNFNASIRNLGGRK